MDEVQIAHCLNNLAQNDRFDNTSRLMLDDVKSMIDSKLTMDDVIYIWRKVYPQYMIEQRTDNIAIIYWEERAYREPILPTRNSFKGEADNMKSNPEVFSSSDNPDLFTAEPDSVPTGEDDIEDCQEEVDNNE